MQNLYVLNFPSFRISYYESQNVNFTPLQSTLTFKKAFVINLQPNLEDQEVIFCLVCVFLFALGLFYFNM